MNIQIKTIPFTRNIQGAVIKGECFLPLVTAFTLPGKAHSGQWYAPKIWFQGGPSEGVDVWGASAIDILTEHFGMDLLPGDHPYFTYVLTTAKP